MFVCFAIWKRFILYQNHDFHKNHLSGNKSIVTNDCAIDLIVLGKAFQIVNKRIKLFSWHKGEYDKKRKYAQARNVSKIATIPLRQAKKSKYSVLTANIAWHNRQDKNSEKNKYIEQMQACKNKQ